MLSATEKKLKLNMGSVDVPLIYDLHAVVSSNHSCLDKGVVESSRVWRFREYEDVGGEDD